MLCTIKITLLKYTIMYNIMYMYIYVNTCNVGDLDRSLSRENPLEKRMLATYSSILAWRIPWTV